MNEASIYWIVTCLLCSAVSCHASSCLYAYGPEAGDELFTDTDNGAAPPINVAKFKFRYFNGPVEEIYVNANGVVSFDSDFVEHEPHKMPFLSEYLPPRKYMAPFWGDHVLGHGGVVWYRLTSASSDRSMRKNVKRQIRGGFRSCSRHFKPKTFLVVTYSNVSAWENFKYLYYEDDYSYDDYYGSEDEEENPYVRRSVDEVVDKRQKRQSTYPDYDYKDFEGQNTYQLVLVTDGENTFAIFSYAQVEWTVSDFDPVMVGFDAGDGQRAYTHPYSEKSDLHNLVTDSNVGVPGRWVYQISGDTILGPGCEVL